jgi:hypothetical protein
MLRWLRKLFGGEPLPELHPSWQPGQYVTYYLERDEGRWVAIAMRLREQLPDGGWVLAIDVKTSTGECTSVCRFDQKDSAAGLGFVPSPEHVIRGPAVSDAMSPEELIEHPQTQIGMALNLLLVRRLTAAREALRGPTRKVRLPCGIDAAHLLITDGPAYKKHHDLCPRVMLTGVACVSIDGGKNPITVTSLGWSDPLGSRPASYDDFVDFSHPKRIEHDGFAVAYPATWFLRSETVPGLTPGQPAPAAGPTTSSYSARLGGNTCSTVFSVTIVSGTAQQLADEHAQIIGRLESLAAEGEGNLTQRGPSGLHLLGDARCFEFDFNQPAIAGYSLSAVFRDQARGRLAQVNLLGCIARENPRREATLAEMRSVYSQILHSFQLT